MSISCSATAIIVVRPGQVEGTSAVEFRGRADLPLSRIGQDQAQRTAGRVALQARPSLVYSSPLERARQTARAIGAATGAPVQVDRDLMDIHYGAWQGRTWSEVEQRWPAELARWEDEPHQAAIPGGETLAHVAARVNRFLSTLLEHHAGEHVVIVGHESVNRILILAALEFPLSAYWRIAQSPSSISLVLRSSTRRVLQSLNHTDHLEDPT